MSSKSVLLITSAQVDLLSEAGKAWGFTKDSIVNNMVRDNLKKIISHARLEKIPIIHSPVAFDYSKMSDFEPFTSIQSVIIQNKLLEMNSVGSDFIDEAKPIDGEKILLPRQGFSSFWANSIQPELKKLEIETIYLAGMLAEGCIESHARDAAENGYQPVVIKDAIGSTSLELFDASLKTLSLHTKKMLSTEEFKND